MQHLALRILLAIGFVTVIELLTPPLGCAQSRLAPAYPALPLFGPRKALGAAIWSHGRSLSSEDSEAPTPPFMRALRSAGWDAFRFNRMRANDTLRAGTQALVEEVHRLKQTGYRRVALAGQSFGGFLSLSSAATSDEVDAVIATAPAAYGTFSDNYETWRANATELYPLLGRVRTARVMLFYFHGDEFDPGGRGERSRDILAEHHLNYMIVDQPPRPTTHWAAGTQLFAQLYGHCIAAFLAGIHFDPDSQCTGGTNWAAASNLSTIAGVPQGGSLHATTH